MHGGRNERAPKGDPIRGGKKPVLFMYASALNRPGDAELIEAANAKLGTLDDEIALCRRNLARFMEANEENARGGLPIPVSGSRGSVTLHFYSDIVAEYLDRIGRLEEKRARIIVLVGGDGRDSQLPNWNFKRANEVTYEEAISPKPDDDEDDADP